MFIIIVTIVIGVVLLKSFMDEVQVELPEAYNLTYQHVEDTVSVMDVIAPFVFVGFGLALIVTAFLINSHPILYIVGFFTIAIGLIVSAGISNALMEMNATTSQYVAPALSLTFALSDKMPYILLAIAIIGAIALYSKTGGASGGV
jgi:hypothetical protein